MKKPIHATTTSLLSDVYNRLFTGSGINKKSQQGKKNFFVDVRLSF